MKNFKNIFVLFIILIASVSMYSCDADVTIDDPQSEKNEDISKGTGNQSNEVEDDED
ncbi:MAG: hypothetical protein L3J20_11335 [Flavobacteriaceae bacterium]|nr:hypothetical protein [Flavobacteriaceae bacterium]